MKKNKIYRIFIIPSMVGLIGFYIIPFLMSIFYSFTKGRYNNQFVGLKNYIDLMESESFRLAVFNTLKYIFIAIPTLLSIALIMALAFNYAIKKNFEYSKEILTANLISMVAPVASVILLVNILFSNYGYINGLLIDNGMSKVMWLSSDKAFWILFGLYIWHNCACCTLIFLSGLSQMDDSILEAASLDGANAWQRFINFTLIEIFPQIIFNTVIAIVGIFKLYRESYLLFGDYPDKSVYMIQNFLNNNFLKLNYQRLSSATVIFFVCIMVPIALAIHLYNKRRN